MGSTNDAEVCTTNRIAHPELHATQSVQAVAGVECVVWGQDHWVGGRLGVRGQYTNMMFLEANYGYPILGFWDVGV